MCGVLGLFGSKMELDTFRLWLGFLTHRGQDASGMAWVEESGKISIAKVHAYPERIPLPSLRSNMILGSTRYPTHGHRIVGEKDIDRFAQPFTSHTPFGHLALIHNGQITNISEFAPEKRYHSDAEAICDYLAKNITQAEGRLEPAVTTILERVDGAFSIVGALCSPEKREFFTFRDKWGFRPLVWGFHNGYVTVTSETVVLDHIGVDNPQIVKPGELITFTC